MSQFPGLVSFPIQILPLDPGVNPNVLIMSIRTCVALNTLKSGVQGI